jgi:lysophospholipase L1-like esterase
VLMIGTNNARDYTAEAIAAGVKEIVAKLRARLPGTRVLVLGIFPRGEKPSEGQRQVNSWANERIAKLADGKSVFFLDIGPRFLTANGTLTREIMPDLLHLSPRGYTIWAESIEPEVKRLLGEK